MPSTRLRAVGTLLVAGLWLSSACTTQGGTDQGAPGGADTSRGADANTGGDGSAGEGHGEGGAGGSVQAGTGTGASAGKLGKAGADGGPSASGAGGGGGEPPDPCPTCASGFCLEDGTCVDCLASDDQCPAGQYCTAANECADGCKDADSCASGSCGADRNCERCISDDECHGGDVCQNGGCGPACGDAEEGEQAGCDDGLTCCSLHCSDTKVDSNHCGACGVACADGQFCGLAVCADEGDGGAGSGGAGSGGAGSGTCVTCHDVTLANLCSIGKVIVILDTNKNDSEGNRVPGRALGAALEAHCDPPPVVSEEEQDSVSALNFTTGRPVSGGGELLLVAGGSFFQNLEGYVEQSISPLYRTIVDNKQQFMSRADDSVVARDTNVDDVDSHDFFAIQFMRDPASGSLVLNLQGFWLSGTQAGSFFIVNGVLPDLAQFDQAWYVYEWTDANDDQQPDLSEIDVVASGR